MYPLMARTPNSNMLDAVGAGQRGWRPALDPVYVLAINPTVADAPFFSLLLGRLVLTLLDALNYTLRN